MSFDKLSRRVLLAGLAVGLAAGPAAARAAADKNRRAQLLQPHGGFCGALPQRDAARRRTRSTGRRRARRRKLEFVFATTAAPTGDATRVAEELVTRENVAFLVGTFLSNVGLAVAISRTSERSCSSPPSRF
jgi:branched-chain amino acid transport system substrate-binding protein